jgi:phosphohistidine phosphatase SixA
MARPFLRTWLLSICLLAFGAVLGAQDTTVVLLRHAERQSLLDGDSPLAEAGLRRAEALVPLLEKYKPEALYASDLTRTQQTLGPLAAKRGLTLQVRPKDGSGPLAEEILLKYRGHTVIVCWHHDLMKKLVRGLGVKGPVPYWPLDTYDWLWIVRVPAKGDATLETRRQELAPAGAGSSQGR